jgi:L-serine dehydratase
MGPRKAAERFYAEHPEAAGFRVTLYGSLAATGRGHMTDAAISAAMEPKAVEVIWKPEINLPLHPNGMEFEALEVQGQQTAFWRVYSPGGGALMEENQPPGVKIYELTTLRDILKLCTQTGLSYWEFVEQCEGKEIWNTLSEVRRVMYAAIDRGIVAEGVLPGGLGLARKAAMYHRKATMVDPSFFQYGFLISFALAVAEENAVGNRLVTAPTCGSAGVLPAVLCHLEEKLKLEEISVLRALATAGLVGNVVKTNASISGAEVGCQGEIGTACAMAAAAATQLMGGTVRQIEYAAEMGLEHHLGLTCDPVDGLVQIPCIERNAFAAAKAMNAANYAFFSDGSHRVSFDEAVEVMRQTGHDLPSLYRETGSGGLARAYRFPPENKAEPPEPEYRE